MNTRNIIAIDVGSQTTPEQAMRLVESFTRQISDEVANHPVDQLADHQLTADQLDDRYNPDGDGEHPRFTRTAWIDEVFNRNTLRGYWDWVANQLEDVEDEKQRFGPG